MALTPANVAQLNLLSQYLVGAGQGPLDGRVAEQLALIFGGTDNCFSCQCGPQSIQDALRDEPYRTFIRLLVCVDAGGGGSDSGGGGGGVPGIDPETLLGTASTYGVLGASTVTNTGATFIFGDLGLSPGTAVTGAPTVSGASHITDAAAAQAQLDNTAAYNMLAALTGATIVSGNIGGTIRTAGVYKSTSTLAISSGELVLNAQGDPNAKFVFQVASALTVTAGRHVVLINGAQAKNVFWQVGSSATIGGNADFSGSILALASITLVTGAVVNGRLLVQTAAVNLDTNVVSVPA